MTTPDALDDLGPLARRLGADLGAVRELEARSAVPLPSSVAWLDLASATHPGAEAWPLLARRDGAVVGWLGLGLRRGPVVTVQNLGFGLVDRLHPAFADPDAATLLARVVTESLARLPRPWRFELEQLPVGDPVATALQEQLPWAETVEGDGCPVVDVADHTAESVGSKSWRKQVRQAANRIERAGSTHDVVEVTDVDELRELLPRLAAVHVARDHDQDRRSDLEDERRRRFWRAALLRLAAEGRVHCWLLHVDGALAAYTIALDDGEVLRNWDGRFEPDYDEFWPGKLMQAAVVRHGAANGLRTVDLMRGVAHHKLRIADRVDDHVRLRAWSDRATRGLDRGRVGARQRVAELRAEHEVVDRTWRAVKRRVLLR